MIVCCRLDHRVATTIANSVTMIIPRTPITCPASTTQMNSDRVTGTNWTSGVPRVEAAAAWFRAALNSRIFLFNAFPFK